MEYDTLETGARSEQELNIPTEFLLNTYVE